MCLHAELLTMLKAGEFDSMDTLYAEYKVHILRQIRENCDHEVLCRYERAKYCLEDGVDIEEAARSL